MQRFFFQCAYDGTNYSGWQKQSINVPTIQEEIESKLAKLFPETPVSIVGCGRTDAGVHAKKSFFHADLPINYAPDILKFKLNSMLPAAIVIQRVFPVSSESHTRFDAVRRTYHYFIHTEKSPFLSSYSWLFKRDLAVDMMNEATTYLLGKKDFTSFSKLHTDVNNNICEIYQAKWEVIDRQLRFEISANRFLRNMVRAIVGTMIEVGLENIPPNEVLNIMEEKNREKAGFSVPAKGLFLINVEYPYI